MDDVIILIVAMISRVINLVSTESIFASDSDAQCYTQRRLPGT